MSIFRIALFSLIFAASSAFAAEGLVRVQSSHDVSDTAERLVDALEAAGMTVFDRINHAEGARNAGLDLRPTELVIFGNPMIGTQLMHCSQSIAVDLPQKMLIWEDADGSVWLGYNDPAWLAERHGATGCEEVLGKIAGALENFANAAK
ncbi:DUF302 domain-containing protein [Marinobacter sp.]|uniref:DUF302 domain-containing protein n=1 Tax=Marinobacter sp. TaxID=50741 RepID=UPI00384D6FD2